MLFLRNFELDGLRATYSGGNGATGVGSGSAIYIEGCHFKAVGGICLNGGTAFLTGVRKCTFTDNVQVCASINRDMSDCEFYANIGSQLLLPAGGNIERCLFYENTTSVKLIGGASRTSPCLLFVRHCVFEDNDCACISPSTSTEHLIIAENCVAIGAAVGYAFDGDATAPSGHDAALILRNCAGSNNSVGDHRNAFSNDGFITLTGDPFVNTAANNYALNSTAGAGEALKAVGFIHTWPRGLTTASNPMDVGAWQSTGTGGGGGSDDWPAEGVRLPYQNARVI